jgi:CRISPR-associated endonuclease Cas2
MYLIVAYDVVANRRRRRLQKAIAGFLSPVQKSVFEGHLLPSAAPQLYRAVAGAIDPATDSVRSFLLCEGCRRSARLFGIAAPLPDPSLPLFF